MPWADDHHAAHTGRRYAPGQRAVSIHSTYASTSPVRSLDLLDLRCETPGCGKKLSQYNRGVFCHAHRPKPHSVGPSKPTDRPLPASTKT